MIALDPLARSRVAGASVVDLVAANEAKGDECGNAQRSRTQECGEMDVSNAPRALR
jgi:hypothetical protein